MKRTIKKEIRKLENLEILNTQKYKNQVSKVNWSFLGKSKWGRNIGS